MGTMVAEALASRARSAMRLAGPDEFQPRRPGLQNRCRPEARPASLNVGLEA